MKLSRSKSLLQGENNRETYATRSRSSRPFSQHPGDSNRSPGRWRRIEWDQLRQHDVQAVAALILHENRVSRAFG
jgi:hypothetical protein